MLFLKKGNKQPGTTAKTPSFKPMTEQTMLENVFKTRHSLGQDHPHYTPSLSTMVARYADPNAPNTGLPDMITKDVHQQRSQKIQGWESRSENISSVQRAYTALVRERRDHKFKLEKGAMIGQTLAYRNRIKDKTITPTSMVDYLNSKRRSHEPAWSATFDETNQYTVLKRGNKEIGRFLHGANAFEKQDIAGTEREVFRKRWGGLRTDAGAAKEFVQDDFGNFTRRHAYRIDTETFYNQVMTANQTFTGKHFRNRTTEEGSAPDFLHASPFEGRLSGMIDHQEMTRRESTDLGKRTVLGTGMLNDNAALFYHQFLGNNDSQRGASLASTPRGIVGNGGEGFGVEKDGTKRVKFVLDLAMVPKRKTGEAPNLFNYNATAMGSKELNQTGLEIGRSSTYKFDSSVTKNREVFLKQVEQRMVIGTVNMKPLDTNK